MRLAQISINSTSNRGEALTFETSPVVVAFSLTNTTSDLSWTAVTNSTAYQLERATDSGFSDATVIYSGSNTSYTDTGTQNTHYYYRVKAKANGYTDSDYSNTEDLVMGEVGSVFWMRGDTLVTAGSEVTEWTDKSLTNNATAAASRNTPNLLASNINGHNVVDFNSEALATPVINGITTYTLYLVFKSDLTSAGNQTIVSQIQDEAGAFVNQGFNVMLSNGTIAMTNRDGSGQQLKDFAFTDISSYHVLMVKFQSNGSGLSRMIAKLDGVLKVQASNLNSISVNNQSIYFGAVAAPQANATYLDGKIAEVFLFSDFHSSLQQEIIHTYLNTRYALGFTFTKDSYTENITYASSIDSGITNLFARVSYDDLPSQPIVILVHGFNQSATDFTDATLQRFRDYGFFVAAVGMRGRNSASGSQDASGREIYDIYDAYNYIITTYPKNVNRNRKILIGYSGGGGNTLAFISRFPDFLCLAVDFFGISDYGYATGYYQETPAQQATLETWIGGTPAVKPNEYKARQHAWSASNHKGKLRMYHDDADTNVLVAHSRELEAQLIADGFTNYVYSESNSGSTDRWIHGLPNSGATGQENIAAETDFSGEPTTLPLPESAAAGTLKINGGVHTSLFRIWLGNGTATNDTQNRRATLTYNYDSNSYTVTPSIDAPETDMTVEIEILSGVHIGKTASGTISTETTFTPAL